MRFFSYAGFGPDLFGGDIPARVDEFCRSGGTHFLVYDRKPEPPFEFRPSIDQRDFADALRARGGEEEVIIYNKIVLDPHYKEWFDDAYERGTRTVVLVGKGRGEPDCPGPPLLDAITYAKNRGYRVGAVVLPEYPGAGERMRQKRDAGADFFVTQIVYDAQRALPVFEQGSNMVLTVSPFGSPKILEIIRNAGVTVPQETERRVFAQTNLKDRLESSLLECENVVSELKPYLLGVSVDNISTGPVSTKAAYDLLARFKSTLSE